MKAKLNLTKFSYLSFLMGSLFGFFLSICISHSAAFILTAFYTYIAFSFILHALR